ncbi:hypothetical protein FBU30_008944 [Linnemannia zychae]|nr:hypothetical protein FBU30_008944 [Linnemannia zychae]
MLVQLATAYREHAEILESKGCYGISMKSRKRADEILSQYQIQGTQSIIKTGDGFVAMAPEARMYLTSAHSSTLTTGLSTCTTPPLTQPLVSLTSANETTPPALRSVVYFDKNTYSFAFDMWSFPSPNCHLQDTRQLAVCLTLLQMTKLPEDELTQEARKWIVSTRSNTNEMERLKKIANDVIYAFIKADIKDSGVIAEVVPLAYNLDRGLHCHLLNSFLNAIIDSALPNISSLDGLAHIVQSADPGYIKTYDLASILQVLNNRLQKAHSEAADYRLLDMSKSDTDLYLSFQVEYAAQALLNVSNDKKPWHTGFRRLWLAISIGASSAKVPDPTEIGMMLEGLEKNYNEGKRDFITLKQAISSKGRVDFTFKDGLQFKSIWYRALRTAELYIQLAAYPILRNLLPMHNVETIACFKWECASCLDNLLWIYDGN